MVKTIAGIRKCPVYDLRKRQENMVLLMLGSRSETEISVHHLEMELFFLMQSLEQKYQYFEFKKVMFRGWECKDIPDILKGPVHVQSAWTLSYTWDYTNMSKRMIHLTQSGIGRYKELVDDMMYNDVEKLHHIQNMMIDIRKDLDEKTDDELYDMSLHGWKDKLYCIRIGV